MDLSPELFERIVGEPAPAPVIAVVDKTAAVLPVGCRRLPERRCAARLTLGRRAKICPMRGLSAGVWQTVMVQDLSTSGVGIISDEPLEVHDLFELHLSDLKDQIVKMRCCVKRCESGGFGGVSFIIGATYAQVLDHNTPESENVIPTVGSTLSATPSAAMALASCQAARPPAPGNCCYSWLVLVSGSKK